jgi:protein-L-isoaspartate(D-aspartate) O-methyltransferase
MKTNEELVDYLVHEGVLKTPRIIEAFRAVDRGKFVLPQYLAEAYEDGPLPIGFGATISQPTTVAFMVELLQPQEGEAVLDVGSGSGWTTALLARLVGANGKVTGTEVVPELVVLGQENLKFFQFPNVEIRQADKEPGVPDSLFDKILVSASAEHLPGELVSQLKTGGRMVIPVLDSLYAVDKTESGFKQKEYYGFIFVPLR